MTVIIEIMHCLDNLQSIGFNSVCVYVIYATEWGNFLISCCNIFSIIYATFSCSGKDTLVKWWDLDTQHCFKTLVGHRSEVSRMQMCR